MLIAVIADTHLPKGRRRLPPRCLELVASSDALIHAGDITSAAELDALRALAPQVHAVHGNVDEPTLRASLPAELRLDLMGHRIAVVHDAGPRQGRLARLARRFPDAEAAIFGHTHRPEHQAASGFQIFNPGSPTERRRSPVRAMGLMHVSADGVRFEHVALR
jgi:putative phosphoesterase